jgi:hypothetical protein
MTKTLSMVSLKNYNLGANEGLVIFLTSKLITCFIAGFTSKWNPYQLLIYSMEVNKYIGFWTLKMKCTQYELYGQMTFKNAKAIYFFEVGQSGQ